MLSAFTRVKMILSTHHIMKSSHYPITLDPHQLFRSSLLGLRISLIYPSVSMTSNSEANPSTETAPPPPPLSEAERRIVLWLALHGIEVPAIAHHLHKKHLKDALVDQVLEFLKDPKLDGTISDVNGLLGRLQNAENVAECDLVHGRAVDHGFVEIQALSPEEARKLHGAEARARNAAKSKSAGANAYNKTEAKKGEDNAAAEAQRLQNARITPVVMRQRLQELINNKTVNGFPIDEW